MNALISKPQSIFRLRENRRLLEINGSPAKTKLYHGAAIASAPEQQHLHQDRIVRYRVNTSFPSFGSARVPSLYNYHAYANISTSSRIYEKTSSKVEETVNAIKKQSEEKEKEKDVLIEKEKLNKSTAPMPESTQVQAKDDEPQAAVEQQLAPIAQPAPVVVKKSIPQRIWAELVHYYHGFRLLFIDINVCRKLLWRIMNGHSLTRREHRLLIRTTSDMFRLLPFSVFIIVPFMELLLPVVIKFFPGMLPSTFQSASDQDAKIKQNLKVKLEMAKFLQKTLDDMSVQHKDHRSEAAKQFSQFFQLLRSGEVASPEDIMKFAKLFEDEITLDSLNRQQIMALCRVLEVNTLGTTNFLLFQLRMKLRSLAADDRVIQKEGIDSLNQSELQSACRARGMRAYGISEERLKLQLQEWINLSLNEKVPPSLLLLSRAMMLPDHVTTSEKLKATISSLPDSVATQTKGAIGEREGKVDNKTKIEIIKEEQRKIEEERSEQLEVEIEKAKKEEILVDPAPIIMSEGIVKPTSAEINRMFIEQTQQSPQQQTFPLPSVEQELTSTDLKILGDALESFSKEKKNLIVEKETIKEIKEEIAEYQEDVKELNEVVELSKHDEMVQIKESKAAKNVYKKVSSMLNKLDQVMEDLEQKEKIIQEKEKEEKMNTAQSGVDGDVPEKKAELVRIDEIMAVIRQVQQVSDESRLQQIQKMLTRIDDDQDGHLKVEDVLKVIETIAEDNVKLNDKQLNELIDLLDKEELLETEDKIEKALQREKELREQQKAIEKEAAAKLLEGENMNQTDEKYVLKDKAEVLKDGDAKGDTSSKENEKINEIIKQVVDDQNEKLLSSTQPPPEMPQIPTPPTTTNKPTKPSKMI